MSDKNTVISSGGGVSANWLILADAKSYLPLIGGWLTGPIRVNMQRWPGLYVASGQDMRIGSLEVVDSHVSLQNNTLRADTNLGDRSDAVSLEIGPETKDLHNIVRVLRNVNDVTGDYIIYGQHNVTISTVAPSATLAEGVMHMTY